MIGCERLDDLRTFADERQDECDPSWHALLPCGGFELDADEFVEGEGEVIEYDGRTDIVKLMRRAELRRYREAQLTDELEGAIIVYNNLTDVFTVDGQKTAPAGTPAGTPGGRVRAVLAPKEPASGAAAPVRGEPPALRTAPSLGGAK